MTDSRPRSSSQDLGRYMGVDMDQGQGLTAGPFAPEFEPGDIDPALSQHRPDTADHARHVVVVQDNDMAFGHGFKVRRVDPHEPDHIVGEECWCRSR